MRRLFAEDDPYGWRVPEIEEEYELQPGLAQIAAQVLRYLTRFGRGEVCARTDRAWIAVCLKEIRTGRPNWMRAWDR